MRAFEKPLHRVTWSLVIVGMIAFAVVAVLMQPTDSAGPCVVVGSAVTLREIPEASGLAVSRRNPGIVWSHNDSGNATDLFALDAAGALLGRVRVPIATRDWEDLAVARCPAGDCLYIADIGDNGFVRGRLQIYRVPEPAPADGQTARPEAFTARYADGPHNAEAFFVVGADMFIVTRDSVGGLYRATQPRPDIRELTFERIGQLGLPLVTDAEASPDESSIVVRTPKSAVVYRTADVTGGGMVPSGLRIPIHGLKEAQGEGVALDGDRLYLASEGRAWSRGGTFITLRCSLSAHFAG